MAELNAIYNSVFLELAASIPRSGRLALADGSGTAHSKLCGSTVTVDIVMRDGRIADFAQTVKACLLGQAAASVVGREAIGSTPGEIHRVAAEMRRMLDGDGPPPTGRWADLALLEPVRDYKARHASTMLVFDALERAMGEIEARTSRPQAFQLPVDHRR
ncbi:MAG: iron-sulfur cluster assembly scaffold protein [Hyphomicrobium sp.]|nr:MAG: iron-sulfur cluster assembly scaffold protein [Hyphomicrobium sp.]